MILFFLLSLSAFAHNITVSGISAGAYMAQQFQIAYSERVSGAGIVAGGPYYCAKNQMMDALNKCMKTMMGTPRSEDSLSEARRAEGANEIDSLNNLRHAKIFVLAGTQDQTVLPEVGAILVKSYGDFGVDRTNIQFVNDMKVGHAFPTLSYGNSCPTPSQSPYISNCSRDIAGEILTHLMGPLNARGVARAENFRTYDQLSSVALDEDKANISMGKTGHAYIPQGCESGTCPIHVAFHGCKQTLDDIGDTFLKNAGYNEWAESNRIIVLYPQAVKSFMPNNPNGCWDWWGYTGPKYHTKNGPQMKVVMKNIEDLIAGNLKFLPL